MTPRLFRRQFVSSVALDRPLRKFLTNYRGETERGRLVRPLAVITPLSRGPQSACSRVNRRTEQPTEGGACLTVLTPLPAAPGRAQIGRSRRSRQRPRARGSPD